VSQTRRIKGTKHFPRLRYNVSRGLREIIAPLQQMQYEVWQAILAEFEGRCAYCGQGSTQENRGIVPDHLIPVTEYGELVVSNAVPACQTCNDARGNLDWRGFLENRFPDQAKRRISAIDSYRASHPYETTRPEQILTQAEHAEYQSLLQAWDRILTAATELYSRVKDRRGLP
jgi:5-methylcytosine-specific restriction endonuclease McrA